ncbi:hypothetical protein L596_029211 [Steinernema carpocapsae]|uniref:ShKT domain-containing protein n=1 Tax=Steinernema carpocapsae TaxID=34508 RepID=A0A4U5LTZ5_STECR|nr:hypothetical protein L596_029211 [Steinernema carpocapsae]
MNVKIALLLALALVGLRAEEAPLLPTTTTGLTTTEVTTTAGTTTTDAGGPTTTTVAGGPTTTTVAGGPTTTADAVVTKATDAPVKATTHVPKCTDTYGNLDPKAISCENEIPDADCEKIMGGTYVAQPAYRPPACYAYPTKVTKMCSKTCALCCENPNYNCKDDPKWERLCPLWKASCGGFGDQVTGAMASMCPATCGLCAAAACRDVLATCPAMAVLCDCPVNGAIFKQQCARTCGACPGSPNPIPVTVPQPQPGCYDLSSRHVCNENKARGFCTNPNWPHVRQRCAVTCGACAEFSVPNKRVGNANCMDNPRTPCDSFKKQGFCQNTYYTLERRMKACGITCGFC